MRGPAAFRTWALLSVLLGAAIPCPARPAAQGPLSVDLKVERRPDGAWGARVTFTNRSAAPVLLEGLEGETDPCRPEFGIRVGGRELAYVGCMAKRTPFQASEFPPLAPGAMRRRWIRLDDRYAWPRGSWRAVLRFRYLRWDASAGDTVLCVAGPFRAAGPGSR